MALSFERAHDAATRTIERARQAGSLRPDFTGEDLVFVFATNSVLSRAVRDNAPDGWRRGVAFTLDGLRTGAAHPLPTAPLTPQQVYGVMGNIAGA
ncbi:hypothetical protein PGH47_03925 [Streptomyces sp. HUAS 31]|uniref:hypothetical protein n=1 Tax=Streptomyces TaxID=1883 RepID=UPI00230533A5|nr:hypothetical protein [Streptomyces sp. HUAS 31]WCD94840.1 hypothetical protein PGH47_03925 [Streptomyces sp. HUAS 31]